MKLAGWCLMVAGLILGISATFNIGIQSIEYFTKLLFMALFMLVGYLFIRINEL